MFGNRRFELDSGVGAALTVTLQAELARFTEVRHRTAVLTTCYASRQIGLLLGPAWTLLFNNLDTTFLGFEVSQRNVAGLFEKISISLLSVNCKSNCINFCRFSYGNLLDCVGNCGVLFLLQHQCRVAEGKWEENLRL